jgi:hypothetical protein
MDSDKEMREYSFNLPFFDYLSIFGMYRLPTVKGVELGSQYLMVTACVSLTCSLPHRIFPNYDFRI